MPLQNHAFGGGLADSSLSPIALVVMLLAVALILGLQRKHIIIPILVGTFLIPVGQQIFVAGVHLTVMRIIMLCGLARLSTLTADDGHRFTGGLGAIDKTLLGCAVCQAVAFVILYNFDVQSLTYQGGLMLDYIGSYLVIRGLIKNEADMYLALKWMAVISVVLALGMTGEQLTGRNVFGMLGGTRILSDVREGKIRSQGSFQHSLTAGTFAATLLPLFCLLWRNGKAKLHAAVGLAACTLMTICSNSSTSLLAYVGALAAMLLWPWRGKMRQARWLLVAALSGLSLVMKAPVWFVIAHVDLTGGSSSYHRAVLIDYFMRHFSDWWLIGVKEYVAASWAPDMWDQQNQFVSTGEGGGLLALVLLIAMLTIMFSRLGKARRLAEGTPDEVTVWLLGVAVFSNIVAFFGVNYFDQVKVGWFVLIACVCAVSTHILEGKAGLENSDGVPALLPAPSAATTDWEEFALQSVRHFSGQREPGKAQDGAAEIVRPFLQ